MTDLESVPIGAAIVRNMQAALMKKTAISALADDLRFYSLMVSYGIAREVGTANDELSRFIFDQETGQLVPRETLRGEVITWHNKIGVRVTSTMSSRLEVRIEGFRDLCHPELGENTDGSFRQLVVFPEMAVKIAALQGVELVAVKSWAMNSIFGGFGGDRGYYETNFWELENNDGILFARLLQNRQLALLGTHDLIAHVAGLDSAVWSPLAHHASRVQRSIERWIGPGHACIPDLVLPYTAGVILDDLAQPPSYGSASHQLMLDEVLNSMRRQRAPGANNILLKYPASFEEVITLSRSNALTPAMAHAAVGRLAREIDSHTAQLA